jgi:hypothetical protein
MNLHAGALTAAGAFDVVPQAEFERRSEKRYEDLVSRAVIMFRGIEHIVPVVDISSRGTQVESAIEPRLGETVIIRFPDCSPIRAFVRWCRDGRLGLNFGHELVLG